MAASESFTIRFPTGAWEVWVPTDGPAVGDVLLRQGTAWTVIEVSGTPGARVVTVERSPDVAAVTPHRTEQLRGEPSTDPDRRR